MRLLKTEPVSPYVEVDPEDVVVVEVAWDDGLLCAYGCLKSERTLESAEDFTMSKSDVVTVSGVWKWGPRYRVAHSDLDFGYARWQQEGVLLRQEPPPAIMAQIRRFRP